MLSACALLWAASDGSAQVAQPVPPVARVSGGTFTNPLMQNGPDPWVIWWKGFYYYSDSSSKNLTLRKTADITDLRHAQKKVVGRRSRGTHGRTTYGRRSFIAGATNGISTSPRMPATMLLIAFSSSRTATMILSKVLGSSRVRSATRGTNGLLTRPRLN